MTDVKLVLEEVTPDRAMQLLAGNIDNRNVRQGIVQAYARDMRNGMWRDGQGEPIHVDPKTSELGNGQHRLLAVLESSATVHLPVLYAPLEWRMTADQGARRTFADVLKVVHHEPGSNQLAAAVRYAWEYRRSGQFGVHMNHRVDLVDGTTAEIGKPTIAELEQTYLDEKGLSNHLIVIGRLREHGVSIFPSLMVALDYLFHEVDYEDAEEFMERLYKGDNLPSDSPILALRRVMQNPSRPHRARPQAALVIKSWNAYRQGETIRLLAFRAGGSSPEAFPKVDGMPAHRNQKRARRSRRKS